MYCGRHPTLHWVAALQSTLGYQLSLCWHNLWQALLCVHVHLWQQNIAGLSVHSCCDVICSSFIL